MTSYFANQCEADLRKLGAARRASSTTVQLMFMHRLPSLSKRAQSVPVLRKSCPELIHFLSVGGRSGRLHIFPNLSALKLIETLQERRLARFLRCLEFPHSETSFIGQGYNLAGTYCQNALERASVFAVFRVKDTEPAKCQIQSQKYNLPAAAPHRAKRCRLSPGILSCRTYNHTDGQGPARSCKGFCWG